MKPYVAILALALAGCSVAQDPVVATQVNVVYEHDAVGNVASTLDGIRDRAPAAVNYTDSQLIYLADLVCKNGAQAVADEWVAAGHDVQLFDAIDVSVSENPFYCDQQQNPWG